MSENQTDGKTVALLVIAGAFVGMAAARIYSIVKVSKKTVETIDKVSENLVDSLREKNGLPPMYSKEAKGQVIDVKKVNGVYRHD